MVSPKSTTRVTPKTRIAMAQVEAILALAAAIAGQQQASLCPLRPPMPPATPA